MVRHLVWAAPIFLATTSAFAQTSPREIVEMTDFSGLSASPDGRWLLYRRERPSATTGRIEVVWYLVAADGSRQPVRIGDGGTASWNGTGIVVPGKAAWGRDSHRFYVLASIGGATGVWTGSIEDAGLLPYIVTDSDIERFAIGSDGAIIYETGPSRSAVRRAEQDEYDQGILVDARVDMAQTLFRGAMISGRAASQRLSGDWFDREPLLADAPRQQYVRTAGATRDRVPTPDEAILLDRTNAPLPPAIRTAFAAAGVCGGEQDCPAPDRERIWTHVATGSGGYAVTTRDRRMRQRIFIWDPAANGLRILAASSGMLNGGRDEMSSCAATSSALFCVAESATVAPELVRIAIADGSMQVIDKPNNLPDRVELLTEAIDWQVGGSRASGWLVRPKLPGRLPLFVTYYRCAGYLRGGLGDEWPLRALATHGIAALCINSLHASGPAPEASYRLAMEAVRTAIDALDRRGIVDPSRVGMGGLSFGSEVTMWIAAHSDMLRAASISSLQLEPAYYWYNAGGGRETFRDTLRDQWKLGAPDQDPERWRQLSPALNVGSIMAPILMQLPEQEARQSPELVARLTAKAMGELHIFPYAAHIKIDPRQKLAVYERNLDWFRFWLQDQVDPDTAKSPQYGRWRMLGPAQRAPGNVAIQRSTSAISNKRK